MLDAGASLQLGFARSRPRSQHRHWSLGAAFDTAANVPVERGVLRRCLEQAVRRQLVSDAPLGVFLSGGIDSSALVGLACQAGHRPTTVSLVFGKDGLSEDRWIDAVRTRWNTDHHEVKLTPAGLKEELRPAIRAMDQPTFDGINTYCVSRAAREAAGLKVALSGLGGDELFGGYPLFREIPTLARIRKWCPRLPRPLARPAARLAGGRGDRGHKLARWLAGDAPSPYWLMRELFEPRRVGALLGIRAETYSGSPATPDFNGISKLELSNYTRNVLLRDSDCLGMAHGLEIRVPLLDRALVELAGAIPAIDKTRGQGEKPLLVQAVSDLLPEEVRTRPKMGFTLPFERWLRNELTTRTATGPTGRRPTTLLAPPARPPMTSRARRGLTSSRPEQPDRREDESCPSRSRVCGSTARPRRPRSTTPRSSRTPRSARSPTTGLTCPRR